MIFCLDCAKINVDPLCITHLLNAQCFTSGTHQIENQRKEIDDFKILKQGYTCTCSSQDLCVEQYEIHEVKRKFQIGLV